MKPYTLCLLALFFCSSLSARSETPSLRIALTPFTAQDNSYASSECAAQFSDILLSALMQQTSLLWVERSEMSHMMKELSLSEHGLADNASALQLGYWLLADLLIKGSVLNATQDSQQLHIEIIDLKHADVLETISIPLRAQPQNSIVLGEDEVTSTCSKLLPALTRACRRLGNADALSYVAPIFFQNENPGGRLDFYENDLMTEFIQANNSTSSFRFIQFPRANQSIQEAELIALGMTDVNQDSWKSLANFYVWGQYREIEQVNVPFNAVKVKTTITIWDGLNQPMEFSVTGRVANLPSMSKQIIKRIIDHTQSEKQTSTTSSYARKRLGRQLLNRAASLQEFILQTEYENHPHMSKTWWERWYHTIQILSVAAFFCPDNAEIRTALLVEQTRDDVDDLNTCREESFDRAVQRSAAWKKYCEQFGFDYAITRRIPGRSRTDNRLSYDYSTAPLAYVGSAMAVLNAVDAVRTGNSQPEPHPYGIPEDIPKNALEDWHRELATEFGNRLLHVAEAFPERIERRAYEYLFAALSNITNIPLRMALTEKLWPNSIGRFGHRYDDAFIVEQVQNTYQQAGKTKEGLALIAMIPEEKRKMVVGKVINTLEAPSEKSQSAPSAEAWAPLIHPVIATVSLRDEFYTQNVTAMALFGDELWLGVRGQRLSLAQACAIMTYNTKTKQLKDMTPLLGEHSQVTSMLVKDKILWITLATDGAWSVDMIKSNIRRYTIRDGLPSHEMFDSCITETHHFFAGGQEFRPALCHLDHETDQWISLNAPRSFNNERCCQVRTIAANNERLAVFSHTGMSMTKLFIVDLSSREWVEIAKGLLREHPELGLFAEGKRLKIVGLSIDTNGLWVATPKALLFFDFETMRFSWLSQPPFQITSMLEDGENLWVAAASDQAGSHILLFNKTNKSWNAQIDLSATDYAVGEMLRAKNMLWLCQGPRLLSLDLSSVQQP